VPDSWLQPSIVLLDAGMATHLAGNDRANMIGLFEAFSELDGPGIGAWALRFSGEQQTCPDPQRFIDDCGAYFTRLRESANWEETGFSNGSEALSGVLELVRQNQVCPLARAAV
jgi:aarF domain-containing kinase